MHWMRFHRLQFLALLFLALSVRVYAAESAGGLTARETGMGVYARQDVEAGRIATLEKGETLFPMAESIGNETWYMVRTKQGLTGWVRAADVIVSNQTKDAFRERESGASTWSARTADGRTFNGTWSVASSSSSQNAGGAWTLSNASGTTVMRGTWSAEKHSTGWNGVWRAAVEGRQAEHSGSWSAELPHMSNARFAELFEAAAKEAIRGLWTGGSDSGSWSIRAVK
jgi:hypothetical protein